MLELAHEPPRSPEDVSFSEAGKFLLVDALHFNPNSRDRLDTLGRVACVELAEKLDGVALPSTEEFNDYGRHVLEQATSIIGGRGVLDFMEGMSFVSLSYLPQSDEVAAA